jgi:hypothetical protein
VTNQLSFSLSLPLSLTPMTCVIMCAGGRHLPVPEWALHVRQVWHKVHICQPPTRHEPQRCVCRLLNWLQNKLMKMGFR